MFKSCFYLAFKKDKKLNSEKRCFSINKLDFMENNFYSSKCDNP